MDLLQVIHDEKNVKKTRIMHKAYLDWNNFKRYMDFLREEGFIVNNSQELNTYEITENGKDLLNKLKDVDKILGD